MHREGAANYALQQPRTRCLNSDKLHLHKFGKDLQSKLDIATLVLVQDFQYAGLHIVEGMAGQVLQERDKCLCSFQPRHRRERRYRQRCGLCRSSRRNAKVQGTGDRNLGDFPIFEAEHRGPVKRLSCQGLPHTVSEYTLLHLPTAHGKHTSRAALRPWPEG